MRVLNLLIFESLLLSLSDLNVAMCKIFSLLIIFSSFPTTLEWNKNVIVVVIFLLLVSFASFMTPKQKYKNFVNGFFAFLNLKLNVAYIAS